MKNIDRTPDEAASAALRSRVNDVGSHGSYRDVLSRLDGVYAERTMLVLALASLFPSGTRKAPVEGMPKEFEMAVFIDAPTGQMCWHYRDDDAALFAHLPPYPGEWDGHSTDEKYRRLLDPKFSDTEERKALDFYASAFEMQGQGDTISAEPTDALCEDAGRTAHAAVVHRLKYRPEPENMGIRPMPTSVMSGNKEGIGL